MEIHKEECRKDDLQQQIQDLSEQLERTNQSLTKVGTKKLYLGTLLMLYELQKYGAREEYDRLIQVGRI